MKDTQVERIRQGAAMLRRQFLHGDGSLFDRVLDGPGAKRLLAAFSDQLRRPPEKQLCAVIATVLASITALKLPHRPDRIEPRAKKRRPKNLPLLTVPREVAREFIRAQRLNRAA